MVYSALAPLYDRLMSHVDYVLWRDFVSLVMRRFCTPVRPPRVLEVGGGTGSLARLLRRGDAAYVGTDRSFSMCKEAQNKGVPFVCADARRLPLNATFDLILFLYDGINYLMSPSDFHDFFAEAHRCLAPDGLLLFDVTTETNSRRHFANYLDFEDFGDAAYARHSYYDPDARCQHNDFSIFVRSRDNELFEKHAETHVQWVPSLAQVRAMVPRDLFEVCGVFDGFSLRKGTARSERIHFLLKKKNNA